MEDRSIIALSSIGCLTLLGAIALFKGIDGTLLAGVIGAICTVAGYIFGKTTNK